MSPRRLAVCLSILGWSARELARRTGEHRTVITRQLDGHASVSAEIAAWIERLVDAHLANPCPRKRALRLVGGIVE